MSNGSLSGLWQWEHLADEKDFHTYRMQVQGGYIVRTVEYRDGETSDRRAVTSAMVFVPDAHYKVGGPR